MNERIVPGVLTNIAGKEQIVSVTEYEFLKKRRIRITGEINHDTAEIVSSSLLALSEKSDEDIFLIINSPGGSVSDGLAIMDTMNSLPCSVITVAEGLAASMGAFLLSCGARRYARPHTEIMLHQPLGGISGQADDISIVANHILYLKNLLAEILANNCEKSKEQILNDINRDRWLTAQQALDYGLIDHIGSPFEEV